MSLSTRLMHNLLWSILLSFLLLRPLPAQSPNDVLKRHYQILREWLRDTTRVQKQVQTFSKNPLDDIIDWEEITRRMFAVNWVNLSDIWQKRYSENTRKKLIKEFTGYLIQLSLKTGDPSLRWGDEEIAENRAATRLSLLHANELEETDLRLILSGSDWKIYDVRNENFRLIQDHLSGFDEMISNGYNNEYVEAEILGLPAFTIDDFNDNEWNGYPRSWGWRKKDDNVMHDEKIYSIRKENRNFFLSAQARNASVALVKPFSYNIKAYPYLSWKWRVRQFPTPDLLDDDDPDRAAAVTVIFYQNWIGIPITLRYIWVPDASPCSIVKKEKLFYNTYSIVLRSESDSSRQWIEENVNPYADYQRIFGEAPPEQIVGIYVLTDSHSLYSVPAADYDDFTAKKYADKISCWR